MNTTSQRFFEKMYRQDSDPWNFASSSYELARYEAIVRSISHRKYLRAFEPACSVGVLTARLASICDQVDAADISPTAVDLARKRCRNLKNVSIYCASLTEQIPASFDLFVLSEVGYYFEHEELLDILNSCLRHLVPDGTLLACHWLGSSPDHIQSGDAVHEAIASLTGLHLELSERHTDFRLDRWRKLAEVAH
jgi:SAM-dependent methyltransferase